MPRRGLRTPAVRNVRARRAAAFFVEQEGLPAGFEAEHERFVASLGLPAPEAPARGLSPLEAWSLIVDYAVHARAARVIFWTRCRAVLLGHLARFGDLADL